MGRPHWNSHDRQIQRRHDAPPCSVHILLQVSAAAKRDKNESLASRETFRPIPYGGIRLSKLYACYLGRDMAECSLPRASCRSRSRNLPRSLSAVSLLMLKTHKNALLRADVSSFCCAPITNSEPRSTSRTARLSKLIGACVSRLGGPSFERADISERPRRAAVERKVMESAARAMIPRILITGGSHERVHLG